MNLSKVKEILIIRLSSLGDILLTTPLIRSLKNQYPDANISFLLKEQYIDLLKYNPHVINVYTLKKGLTNRQNIEANNLVNKKFDLIIDLQNNLRSRLLTYNLKAPVKRFNKKSLSKFLLVNFKINKLKNVPPISVRYSQTLKNFNLDSDGLDFFFPEQVDSILTENKKYIGFAPGSRHFTKMWPKKYFSDLGNFLTKGGFTVVLLGGEDDRETCKQIANDINSSVDLSNDDMIFSTAAAMKKCSAIICNDSGMMHLACALSIPVLSIFGSTVEEFGFTPYKNKNIILENENLGCRPCSHIGLEECPKKHFKCMMEITPLTAFNKLKLLLDS